MERIGIVNPGAADEKLPRIGRCSEISVIKSSGMNVDIGCGVSPAASTDVSPYQASEVFIELGHHGAGASGAVVARKSKDFASRTVKNDGIRDTE